MHYSGKKYSVNEINLKYHERVCQNTRNNSETTKKMELPERKLFHRLGNCFPDFFISLSFKRVFECIVYFFPADCTE